MTAPLKREIKRHWLGIYLNFAGGLQQGIINLGFVPVTFLVTPMAVSTEDEGSNELLVMFLPTERK